MQFIAIITLIFGLAASTSARADDEPKKNPLENPWLDREMTKADLLPSLELGAEYLLRHQLPDGKFIYINDPFGRCCHKKPDKYSIIRHLGAVYALLRANQVTGAPDYLEGAK